MENQLRNTNNTNKINTSNKINPCDMLNFLNEKIECSIHKNKNGN